MFHHREQQRRAALRLSREPANDNHPKRNAWQTLAILAAITAAAIAAIAAFR